MKKLNTNDIDSFLDFILPKSSIVFWENYICTLLYFNNNIANPYNHFSPNYLEIKNIIT